MDRYRIIGKSRQMSSVFLFDKNGKLRQHRVIAGKKIDVDEDQLSFHVHRLVGMKAIKLVKLEEEAPAPVVEAPVVLEEPKVVEALPVEESLGVTVVETQGDNPPRRRRRKKRMIESDTEQEIDETEDETEEESVL